MSTSELWCLRIRLPYKGLDGVIQLLESMNMQAISFGECEDALPLEDLDDQGFPIASEFYAEGYSKVCPGKEIVKQNLEILSALLGVPVPTLTLDPVDNTDWLSVCYQHLAPRQLGRYYVFGSHNPAPSDPDLIPLKIDAATAFGSGDHPTTSGCLLALDGLTEKNNFKAALDMGCGSGILAIAMAKTWPQGHVMAADNDPESVRVTKQNALLNECQTITALVSEGFQSPQITQAGPFDLITANILAKPLCLMAPDMKQCLKSGGFVILSGLLNRQSPDVLKAYEAEGFVLIKTYPIEDWVTLLLQKKSS